MSTSKDIRKRPAGTPEAEKQEPKRTKSFDPREEAVAVAKRKPMPAGREAGGTGSSSSAEAAGVDEVFNPQDKTTAESSLDVSDESQLFELALETNLEEAMDLAETAAQKARVFAAIKAREAEAIKVDNHSYSRCIVPRIALLLPRHSTYRGLRLLINRQTNV
jgi:hypothetical protein